MGWQPTYDFDKGMKETVQWYAAHKAWWQKLKSGEYLEYYKKQYEER
jgi:dTDP-glucose 4,6-dehydratase